MSHRLTDEVMRRTNAQRKALGKPLLSRAGFEHALTKIESNNHVMDVLIIALVNHVVSQSLIADHTSAYEVPMSHATPDLNIGSDGVGTYSEPGTGSVYSAPTESSSPVVDGGSFGGDGGGAL